MRKYPLIGVFGVFVVLFLYGAMFIASPAVNEFLHGVEVALAIEGDVVSGTGTPADASILQIPFQLLLVVFLVTAITILRWWPQIRLNQPRHLVYTLPFILLLVFLFVGVLVLSTSRPEGERLLDAVDANDVLLVAVFYLLVGTTEELMFRGLLLNGLRLRMPVIAAVIVSGIIFGVFHFLNLLAGHALDVTTSQVINVTSAGILYGALYVVTSSIFVVILLHALYDFGLVLFTLIPEQPAAAQALAEVPEQGIQVFWPLLIANLVYAAFLLWKHQNWNRIGAMREHPVQ